LGSLTKIFIVKIMLKKKRSLLNLMVINWCYFKDF